MMKREFCIKTGKSNKTPQKRAPEFAEDFCKPLQMSKAPLAVGKRSFSCLQVLINRSGAADVFRARAGAEDVGLADLFD